MTMEYKYNTVALALEKIRYVHYTSIVIYVDLKLQRVHTKYPCFLCLWDSRDKIHHWVRQEWPKREDIIVGGNNVIYL